MGYWNIKDPQSNLWKWMSRYQAYSMVKMSSENKNIKFFICKKIII